jgi:anaerobic magnesium-protoporphyrin IX monomethyl ester cyclase
MIDCLLISPPFFFEKGNMWKEMRAIDPPLALAALAAWIRIEGYNVNIIDCDINARDLNLFKSLLEKEYFLETPNLIGFTCCTTTSTIAYEYAKIAKSIFRNSKIVFGGPHASFATKEVLSKDYIDFAVIGEGEITLSELLKGKNVELIDGLAYKTVNREIVFTKERKRIQSIDSIPIPAYDLLAIEKYSPPLGSFKRKPSFIITTSRGCPGKCSFCTKTLGTLHLQKSAEKIFDELYLLNKKYGIVDIVFHDDTFTADQSNIEKLCRILIQKKLDISWHCFSRIDYIDENLIKLMKKAGCHQIMFGIESFDKKILKSYNKNIDTSAVKQIVNILKKHNITSRLAFIVGGPDDTENSLENTISILKEINPDLIVVNMATPFPGTDLYKHVKEKQILVNNLDWTNYTGAIPIIKPENLRIDQVYYYYKKFYKSFYLRAPQIFRIIRRLKYYGGFLVVLKAGIGIINIAFNKRKNYEC